MPWLSVNQTRLCRFSAVPTPDLALDVQRGSIPGHPGAKRISGSLTGTGLPMTVLYNSLTGFLQTLWVFASNLEAGSCFFHEVTRGIGRIPEVNAYGPEPRKQTANHCKRPDNPRRANACGRHGCRSAAGYRLPPSLQPRFQPRPERVFFLGAAAQRRSARPGFGSRWNSI